LGGSSAEEVLQLATSTQDLTAHAALAVVGRLAALAAREGAGATVKEAVHGHRCLPRLYSQLQRDCAQLPLQPLVRFLQQCVRLGLRPPPALLAEAASRLETGVAALRPADAVRAAWALTKLDCSDVGRLLGAIDGAVQQDQQQRSQQQQVPVWLAALDPPLLVMLLWTCSKAGHRSEALLLGVTRALAGGGSAGAAAALPAAPPLAGLRAAQLSMLFYSLGLLRWAPDDEASSASDALPPWLIPRL
jgi:hypothetical protein